MCIYTEICALIHGGRETVPSEEQDGEDRMPVRAWRGNKESKWEPRRGREKAIHHRDESRLGVAFCRVGA